MSVFFFLIYQNKNQTMNKVHKIVCNVVYQYAGWETQSQI